LTTGGSTNRLHSGIQPALYATAGPLSIAWAILAHAVGLSATVDIQTPGGLYVLIVGAGELAISMTGAVAVCWLWFAYEPEIPNEQKRNGNGHGPSKE